MMTTTWFHKCSWIALLFTLILAGCPPIETGTPGVAGRVTFFGNHNNLSGLLFAAGGATFDVNFDSPEAVASIESSDPFVLEFTPNGPTGFHLETRGPGTAAVILRNRTGQEIDRLPLRVAAVAQLEFGMAVETVRLLSGAQLTVRFVRQDAEGHQLAGQGGLQASATGSVVLLDPGLGSQGEYRFTGEPGQGTLEVEAGDARVSLPIEVVGAEELVRLEGTAYAPYTAGNQVYAPVLVRAFTAEGPVYGVRCSWQALDAGLQALDQNAIFNLAYAPSSTTTFNIPRPGTYQARCDAGNLMTTVAIKR